MSFLESIGLEAFDHDCDSVPDSPVLHEVASLWVPPDQTAGSYGDTRYYMAPPIRRGAIYTTATTQTEPSVVVGLGDSPKIVVLGFSLIISVETAPSSFDSDGLPVPDGSTPLTDRQRDHPGLFAWLRRRYLALGTSPTAGVKLVLSVDVDSMRPGLYRVAGRRGIRCGKNLQRYFLDFSTEDADFIGAIRERGVYFRVVRHE